MSNRELPMMPWYPDQFRASTAGWTFAERAVYRALLDLQWAQDVIPDSDLRLAKAVGLNINHFRRAWKTVRLKFPCVEDGSGLRNFRLEQHRLAALKYIDGRRRGAQATNAKRLSQSDRSALAERVAERVASESPPSPSEDKNQNSVPPERLLPGKGSASAEDPLNDKKAVPNWSQKPEEEGLRERARILSAGGAQPGDIVRMLGQYHVTVAQVRQWISGEQHA
jgi:uncharacterized protein YdaU (DUF1376 family)